MTAFSKINAFVADLGTKVHNLNSDTFKVALSNTAVLATNAVLADITEITAANGYSAGGNSAGAGTYSQSSGTAKFLLTDTVFTASGGSIGPFRYAVVYNSTAASKNLVGWYDYGSSITITDTNTFTVDFDGTNGVFQLA